MSLTGLPWSGIIRAPAPKEAGLRTAAREPPAPQLEPPCRSEDPKQPLKKKEFGLQVGYSILLCSRRTEHRIGTDGPTESRV